jgi:4-amino-4-deoxychorismate lyase
MIIAASFDVNKPELWVNRGLSYGDGLFETMRMSQQTIPLLDLHLNRLNTDLGKLQLRSLDRAVIDAALKQLDQSVGTQLVGDSAVIKLYVFRANQARTYTPLTEHVEWLLTADEVPQVNSKKALKLAVAEQRISQQPMLAGIKHLSRLEQVMLSAELNQYKGIDDLLLLDKDNHIIETSHQNVIMIRNNQLITPNLGQSGVKGVALQWLQASHDLQFQHISIKDLIDCDGMMVSNSIRGFRLVESVKLNRKQCISFGTSHPIHDKISGHWEALFNS